MRATRKVLVTLLLAASIYLPISAAAQEPGEEKPKHQEQTEQEEATEDEPPEADPPPKEKPETPAAGGLPFEDPSIKPHEQADLETEKKPSDEIAVEEEKEPPSDRPTGVPPVEDPTLLKPAEPKEEPEVPGKEEPPEKPEEEAAPKEPVDEGPDVKVNYDRGFLLSINDWFFLALGGLLQARYTLNYRTQRWVDPETMEQDKKVTQGFDVARARFTLGVGLTEFVAVVMRFGIVAGGDFEIQRGFIDLKWKYFRLRAGLFMNEIIAESMINPWDLFLADYTIVDNVYTPGSSKGVMFTYLRYRFSLNVGYSDGLRTGFSEIRSAANADYAITIRTQYAWGDAGLTGFNRLNARRGTPFGIRLGGAAHYQDGGRTQGSIPARIGMSTIDLLLRGSGWSVFVAGTVGQDATDATETNEAGEVVSGGVTAMGGYFVLDDLEVFGQYSLVARPRIKGELPPMLPGGIAANPSNFQSFGVGVSYWVIPGHDNVKVTSDFQYFLGRERGSLVPFSPLNSIQPNDAGSQFAWRIQISGAF